MSEEIVIFFNCTHRRDVLVSSKTEKANSIKDWKPDFTPTLRKSIKHAKQLKWKHGSTWRNKWRKEV